MSDLLESLVTALQERVIPIETNDGTKAVAVAEDFSLKSLESFKDRPFRQRGSQTFQNLNSLLDYAEAYAADSETAIFADTKGKVTAVLNWHDRGSDEAGWGDHRAEYLLTFTPEWQAWAGINGRAMTQTAFAEFLEEFSGNVTTPDPAALLDAVTKLSGKRNITFESSRRLDNGDTAIVWKEETTAGGAQQGDGAFPSQFTIKVPIYKGAETSTTFEIKALLRYRINEGKLTFEVKLLHVDKIKELAFEELLQSVRKAISGWEASGVPVYIGEAAKL